MADAALNDRARLWRCIREAAQSYDPPDHLGEDQLLRIARALTCGVAPICEDQKALGPMPDWMLESHGGTNG